MTDTTNAATAEELARRNRELAILNAIAEALNRTADTATMLESVLSLVAELFGLRAGWVWLRDPTSGAFYLAAAVHLPPYLSDNPERMAGWLCYCLETFENGDLTGAANVNVLECSRLNKALDGTDGLRYHASIPIYVQDKGLGVFNIASRDWRQLDPADLQLLYTIGYQIGLGVERARLSERATLLATVEERNRLAREIHDTLAQGLTAITLKLEAADALLTIKPQKAHGMIRDALALAQANLEDARRSVLDLRAAPLQEGGLHPAIAAVVRALEADTAISAAFESNLPQRHFAPRLEAGLYRIAQEALTNVRRHAAARNVAVGLYLFNQPKDVTAATFFDVVDVPRCANPLAAAPPAQSSERQWLVLTVEDDGRGFDPDAVQAREGTAAGGFGLIGINERLRLMGGALRLASTPSAGTQVMVAVPVQK